MRFYILYISFLSLSLNVYAQSVNSRIVNGTDTDIRDVPWQISLQYQIDTNNLTHNCGGTIIDDNGKLPVCFIATNHTTGGNSGSPALNAKGELIGLNFDRAWEGTMSDINYDASRCRNIMVDARYILFVIDKYADSGYLLDEMTIN